MSGTPWMKFYPSDWRADPALRMCSIAARGLWMEMLCVMHEAGGDLTINGKPVTDRQLALLAGCQDIAAPLMELEDAGVFSRHDDGSIFSRRMVRDIEKAAADKANGKKGGNPELKEGVNPPDKAQKPEARSQEQISSLRSDSAPAKPTPRHELERVLDEVHANAVIEHRQRLRKPLTAHAASMLATKLAQHSDPNAAADIMVMSGWLSFETSWLDNRSRGSPAALPKPPSQADVFGMIGARYAAEDQRGTAENRGDARAAISGPANSRAG